MCINDVIVKRILLNSVTGKMVTVNCRLRRRSSVVTGWSMDRIVVILASLIATFNVGISVCYLVYHDANLYEGSMCDLPTQNKGICTNIRNCSGTVTVRDANICGYVKNDIIICCSKTNYTGPYPLLIESCADRQLRAQENWRFEQEVERRRLEEIEIHNQHMLEYGRLPGKFIEDLKAKCKLESEYFEDENEKASFLEKCEMTEPTYGLGGPPDIYPSKLKQHPHMAALGWKELDGSLSWNCGGTLVHHSFVLTAAHCIKNIGRPPSVIRLGDLDLRRSHDDEVAVNYDIEGIFVHDQYDPPSYYNDIAILKVKKSEEFRLKTRALPACLWMNEELPADKLLMMGYGAPEFGRSFLEKLFEGNLTVLQRNVCTGLYNTTQDLPVGIVHSQICAQDPEGILDTCEGDSGGPLQYNAEDDMKTPFVAGITSFGVLCLDGNPGVYTRIYSYLDWIEKTIKENLL